MADLPALTYLQARGAAAIAAQELAAHLPEPFEVRTPTLVRRSGSWFVVVRTEQLLGTVVTPRG